jgi:hypothetical protein
MGNDRRQKRDLHALDEHGWYCVIPVTRRLLIELPQRELARIITRWSLAVNAFRYYISIARLRISVLKTSNCPALNNNK